MMWVESSLCVKIIQYDVDRKNLRRESYLCMKVILYDVDGKNLREESD